MTQNADRLAGEQRKTFHKSGNFAPVESEQTLDSLQVAGELPADLNGLYVRNGPNPAINPSSHWFVGDGMLHGINFNQGKVGWYRNRYVHTKMLRREGKYLSDDGSVDRTVCVANTNIVRHAGKMLALVENAFPMEVNSDLSTVGSYDFNGKLNSAMTAHPKICPTTGDMLFFGYHFAAPYLTYNRSNAAGELVFSRDIDVTGPTMIHDFAITENHVIFLDLPVVFDMALAMSGESLPYIWSDDYPARIGVLPRNDEAAPVCWFDIDPCYVFHVMNAFDDADGVVLDAARYPKVWQGDNASFTSAYLYRWEIDLIRGTIKEKLLESPAIEFPRTNEGVQGRPYRYGYAPIFDDGIESQQMGRVGKLDWQKNEWQLFDFGEDVAPGEFVFAPAANAKEEDDGYLLGFAYRSAHERSSLYVFDARFNQATPLARVDLPVRVPFGFHGNWMPN